MSTTIATKAAPLTRYAKAFLSAAALAALLAGCQLHDPEIVGSIPDDVRVTHPIVLAETLATMDVPVGPSTTRLTDAELGNIGYFVQRYRDSGTSTVSVLSPVGSANAAAAGKIARDIGALLARSGVPPKAIVYQTYSADPREANAAVRLAFARNGARTAECGLWHDQIADSSENKAYANFGCATQQNLAAMVANPLDLAYPRAETPGDSSRQVDAIKKYETGDAYQSDSARVTGGKIADFPQGGQ